MDGVHHGVVYHGVPWCGVPWCGVPWCTMVYHTIGWGQDLKGWSKWFLIRISSRVGSGGQDSGDSMYSSTKIEEPSMRSPRESNEALGCFPTGQGRKQILVTTGNGFQKTETKKPCGWRWERFNY